MKRFVVAILPFAFGCSTVNNLMADKTKVVEIYHIFDIKTQARFSQIADSASKGLGSNVNSANETRPIPKTAEAPDKPGRFQVVDMLEGTKLASFAALSGGAMGLKFASCDGALWTAQANREISGWTDLRLSACLFPYKGGYHLDVYATFKKKEGGLDEISRSLASAAVGTPEQ